MTIRTVVHADGSCTRRIEYRLERTSDAAKPSEELAKEPGYQSAPEKDPLHTVFRLPAGEPWRVQDQVESEHLHLFAAEATWPSVNDLDWDYWSVPNPGGPPTRNHFSFWSDTSGTAALYDFAETFRPTLTRLAAARKAMDLLARSESVWTDAFLRGLDDPRVDRTAVRRVVHDRLDEFQRRVEALAARPLFGPRERQELKELGDGFEKEPLPALEDLLAGIDEKRKEEAAGKAWEALGPGFENEMAALGISLSGEHGVEEVHWHVTLVMPAAITRANTCFSGDTATWEFDQDDVADGGFEMWARVQTR